MESYSLWAVRVTRGCQKSEVQPFDLVVTLMVRCFHMVLGPGPISNTLHSSWVVLMQFQGSGGLLGVAGRLSGTVSPFRAEPRP